MTKAELSSKTNELEHILKVIKEYNDSDQVDEQLEIYLDSRQYELTEELRAAVFGENVRILRR